MPLPDAGLNRARRKHEGVNAACQDGFAAWRRGEFVEAAAWLRETDTVGLDSPVMPDAPSALHQQENLAAEAIMVFRFTASVVPARIALGKGTRSEGGVLSA